jgi:ELWxxDGT repeat protein
VVRAKCAQRDVLGVTTVSSMTAMPRQIFILTACLALWGLMPSPSLATTGIDAKDRTFSSLGPPQMLLDINPVGDSTPHHFVRVGSTEFFAADDDTHGVELWATDGTSAGTHLVDDINPGGSSYPQWLTSLAGRLYFWADDGTHGIELWTSDGTPAGTHILKDIYPGTGSSGGYLSEITTAGGVLFFEADDGVHRDELWRSNGSVGGTVIVKGIKEDPFPHDLTPVGKHLFFATYKSSGTSELWTTDGSRAGTVLLKSVSDISDVAKWKSGVIASGVRSGQDPVLWKSHGTPMEPPS